MAIKAVVFDAYGTLYDVASVSTVADQVFPGYGAVIAGVWRQKQLEYTWLRTLMGRYEDLSIITRESLAFTLRCLGLKYDPANFQRIAVYAEAAENRTKSEPVPSDGENAQLRG